MSSSHPCPDEDLAAAAESFGNALKTRETGEVEPGVVEFKFDAAGIGETLVWEDVNAEGVPTNRIPLVGMTPAGAIPLPPGAWAAHVATAVLVAARVLRAVIALPTGRPRGRTC